MAKTLPDVVWLLASSLIDMNRSLLDDVLATLADTDGRLDNIEDQLRRNMTINEENQARLDELAQTLETQFDEVQAALEELRNQPGAQALDFTRLETAVGEVRDTVPDVEPPVEG